MELVFKIAAGVLLAVLILVMVARAHQNYQISEITRVMQEESAQKKAQAEQNRATALAHKVAAKKAELSRADIERRKQIAWAAFYQVPEDCLSFKSEAHMIECGNQNVRAKKAFDDAWRSGRFR